MSIADLKEMEAQCQRRINSDNIKPVERVDTSVLLHRVQQELLDRKPKPANPFKQLTAAQLHDEIATCNKNIAACKDTELWQLRKQVIQDELQTRRPHPRHEI